MATLGEVRTALAETVIEAVNAQVDKDRRLTAYATVVAKPHLPALVVMPGPSDFMGAMGRGLTTLTFRLYVLTSMRDFGLGQNELDVFVADAGPLAIREIIWNKNDLGLLDDNGRGRVQAVVTGMDGYGGQHDAAGIEHIGAILNCDVRTLGKG